MSKNPTFDITEIVGKPLAEVITSAKAAGLAVRLIEVDGEPYSWDRKVKSDRIGLKVESGIVVFASKG